MADQQGRTTIVRSGTGNTATIRKTRQDLARVKTILTQRADAAIEAAVEEKA